MNESEKTVLVTGGNGFIGTMICKLLVQSGHDVINIDRSKKQQEGVTLYPFDIDNSQIDGVIKLTKPDTIIHLAADHEVGRSVTEPDVFYKNNVMNTIGLLNSAIAGEVKNFIFSSSSSVYGDVLGFPTTEDSPKVPMSPYGRTKAMVEDILKDYSEAFGLNFVALRYFNAAGADPENTHGYTLDPASHLIPIICKKIIAGEKLIVNGDDYSTPDGTVVRDYTHVFDIATAHLAAMNYLGDGGASTEINIGAGNGQSILEVIKAFEDAGHKVDYEIGPRRAGDPPMTFADISKANDLLGWSPIYGINDIVEHAMAWEQKQSS